MARHRLEEGKFIVHVCILSHSHFQLSKAAFEHCADARRLFVLQIGNEPLEQLVAADEAAVNILTSYQEKDGLEKDYKLGNKLVLYEVPSA